MIADALERCAIRRLSDGRAPVPSAVWDERLLVNQDSSSTTASRSRELRLLFDPKLKVAWECRQSITGLLCPVPALWAWGRPSHERVLNDIKLEDPITCQGLFEFSYRPRHERLSARFTHRPRLVVPLASRRYERLKIGSMVRSHTLWAPALLSAARSASSPSREVRSHIASLTI